MDEDTFWLAIWRLVGICFCIVVISLSSCSMIRTYTKGELVKSGKDPLEVRCLWETDSNSDAICVLVASRR